MKQWGEITICLDDKPDTGTRVTRPALDENEITLWLLPLIVVSMASRVVLPAVSSRHARHLARSYNESSLASSDDYTEPLLDHGASSFNSSIHYQSIYDSTEFSGSLRNRQEVMRRRLKSHFMTPLQKYKHRGRKPWKLLLQFLKLIMVTVQV